MAQSVVIAKPEWGRGWRTTLKARSLCLRDRLVSECLFHYKTIKSSQIACIDNWRSRSTPDLLSSGLGTPNCAKMAHLRSLSR
jgi:hypothetical protein